MESQEEPLFATDRRSIKRTRQIFKMMIPVIPPGIGLVIYLANTDSDRLWAALIFTCGVFLILLFTGYTTVIGLRIYEHRFEITTLFSENTYRWEQVRTRGFSDRLNTFINPYRLDIYIKGVFLPYIYAHPPWSKRDKTAIPLILERIPKRRG